MKRFRSSMGNTHVCMTSALLRLRCDGFTQQASQLAKKGEVQMQGIGVWSAFRSRIHTGSLELLRSTQLIQIFRSSSS